MHTYTCLISHIVAQTYPGGPSCNLMGITESDLHLSICARYDRFLCARMHLLYRAIVRTNPVTMALRGRRKPRFLDTVYDLFSSGDFFSHWVFQREHSCETTGKRKVLFALNFIIIKKQLNPQIILEGTCLIVCGSKFVPRSECAKCSRLRSLPGP